MSGCGIGIPLSLSLCSGPREMWLVPGRGRTSLLPCSFVDFVETMWAMKDDVECDVTRDFYRYMLRTSGAVPNFRDSAEALHLATKEMRKRKLSLDRWVKFVHVGA